MGLRSILSIIPNLTIKVWRASDNKLLRTIQTKNKYLLYGRTSLRDIVLYPEVNPGISWNSQAPNYIAIGSNGTTTTDTMPALLGEVLRKEITRKIPLASGWKYFHRIETSEANGGGTQELREVGLLAESSGGYLWARATHTLVEKTIAIALTYEWEFQEVSS